MALLKLSIKWKLSIALIFSGLTLVGIYVYIAKGVFESDKISYVFDSQSSKLESLKQEIEGQIERTLLVCRSVLVGYNSESGLVSNAGKMIFNEEKTLLALDVWSERKKAKVLGLTKDNVILPKPEFDAPGFILGTLKIVPLSGNQLLVTSRYDHGESGIFRIQALLDMANFLPAGTPSQSFALAQGDVSILSSDMAGIENNTFQEMLLAFGSDQAEKTLLWGESTNRYLISKKNLKFGELKIISATPEAEALGALRVLFKRSVIFLFFSTFGLILISISISQNLTSSLTLLTKAASEIGKGNFEATPKTTSYDETGILIRAFQRMSQEIQELLVKTIEKARMEAELKTASLVQERLYPANPSTQIGEIQISGSIRTSSECGGDWWHYFTRGNHLFVAIADATGHGTPAALITAAARSVFSRLESENLTLQEMMEAWNTAIFSCSQEHVLMTGILLKIDIRTGIGSFVNAAHESPYHLSENASFGFDFDILLGNASARLGTKKDIKLTEINFELKPNNSIILYTDGLFSIEKPNESGLSEKRFSRELLKKMPVARSAAAIMDLVYNIFDNHRGAQGLPDDISIVSLRRIGPDQSSQVEIGASKNG
jgi:sigma-B regulation protein RsbU (phosphoserine phosphatase)